MSIQLAEISDDFVGVFDGFFGDEVINRYLYWFKSLEEAGVTATREESSDEKLDDAYDSFFGPYYTGSFNIEPCAKQFLDIFWERVYPHYTKKYGIISKLEHHNITEIKIQHTKPGEGYHVWHPENTGNNRQKNRFLVFTLYLNDVEEGGETEFLYQKKRFKPVRDRLLIFPAGFTHTHRGNPPLSGDKYILTGWVEFMPA